MGDEGDGVGENSDREEKFPLGQVCITPGALDAVAPEEVLVALARHQSGDWGNVCEEDKKHNDGALQIGNRLLSAFESAGGTTFWIITEWDRSATTVLLPSDY